MTAQDMICLVELWFDLSSTAEGAATEYLVLPGNITGKHVDRYFKCIFHPWDGKEDWKDYLSKAVLSVDFQEINHADWVSGQG